MVEDTKDLLEKNLKLTQETLKIVKKINRKLILKRITSILAIIIFIVVPIWLGIIYLYPLLKKVSSSYSQVIESVEKLKKIENSEAMGIINSIPN